MRDKTFITWLIVGLVILALLNLPAPLSSRVKSGLREGVGPLQGVLSGMSYRVREAMRVLRGLGGMIRENREMAAQLVRLRGEVQYLKSLEQDNIELRNLMGFQQQSARRDLIPCEVIGRDVSGWWQTIRLGKGSLEGLEKDRAVVTTEGLVGRTIDVSGHTTDVLLISDPGCRVSARISRTGTFGLVNGRGVSARGRAGCRMTFINKNVAIRPGDEVLTSGMGGVFPKGLLIGYVEEVYKDDSGLYQHADVVPKADLGILAYVFVVSAESGEAAVADPPEPEPTMEEEAP